MNFHRFSLYFSAVQLAFSAILLGTLQLNSNIYALYHTLAISLFMLITAVLGIYFSWRGQGSRVVADAWLIISIVTAYIAIDVSPFFNSPVKPLELALTGIVTVIWVVDLYIAWRAKLPVLRL
ncbi:MAG: hypothetical protein RXQ74_02520 [Caldivirga sp.]|jgi:hypothetical protein|uniref:hypothetical protein n=1 Tax=Caldivirga sp. MU80 TaxID=1650354 RepID=UPI0007471DCE|nr:hypothetical protein [Caldivirga sp. MU80]KUO89003.1 MAG: hypothetical protein AT712_00525 [Caldivirga sp. CIS_19]NAZ28671.1 hypothetical protein [Caldivirga sp.]